MSLGWGGYANGRIPGSAMHVIPNFKPIYAGVTTALASNMLMTEAAVQFSGLAKAFYERFGKPLYVSEAYRRLDRQQSLYADYRAGRGNLAAYPGTSNHGWGRSLDLASNVNVNGSAENGWVRQQGPRYGFYFTVPSEAWHVDYLGSASVHVQSYISNPNGSDLPSVKAQQEWLNSVRKEKLKEDGQNGPATKDAVKRYQQFLKGHYGYTGAIDGVWGPGVQAAHEKYRAARIAAASQSSGGSDKPAAVDKTVKAEQEWLISARGEKIIADGKKGPATTAAFKRYQQFLRSYGYTGAIDGIWGSGMQTAHRKYYTAYHAKASRPTIKVGSSGQQVKDLQNLLNKYHGEKLVADGKFGNGTKDAVVRFQRKSKLTADGIVGAATWKKLGQ